MQKLFKAVFLLSFLTVAGGAWADQYSDALHSFETAGASGR